MEAERGREIGDGGRSGGSTAAVPVRSALCNLGGESHAGRKVPFRPNVPGEEKEGGGFRRRPPTGSHEIPPHTPAAAHARPCHGNHAASPRDKGARSPRRPYPPSIHKNRLPARASPAPCLPPPATKRLRMRTAEVLHPVFPLKHPRKRRMSGKSGRLSLMLLGRGDRLLWSLLTIMSAPEGSRRTLLS
ncbi:SH3 and multiple ankyrin repeat domains protein 1-like [Rhea pennata]|uniref:SH3 and multiple ankyrin repeat domains protein 1-like n=1 Tax=Rhea pennata TaxID=8795 RepID=UPI002E26918E